MTDRPLTGMDAIRCEECGGELIEPTFITRRGFKICFPCGQLRREPGAPGDWR
jgi:hypothetical protein